MQNYLKKLRERSRRTILRLINKGEISWEGDKFVNKETKVPIEGL